MGSITQFLSKIRTFLDSIRNIFVTQVQQITGVAPEYAGQLSLAILGYIFLLLLVFFFHKSTLKSLATKTKKCISEYDRIRYHTAKVMYTHNQQLSSKGEKNQLAHGARSILQGAEKDYFSNNKKILEDIKKLEAYLQTTVVPPEVLRKTKSYLKKIQHSKSFSTLFYRMLVVMTLGIYGLTSLRLPKSKTSTQN